jgi:hypothetical protein
MAILMFQDATYSALIETTCRRSLSPLYILYHTHIKYDTSSYYDIDAIWLCEEELVPCSTISILPIFHIQPWTLSKRNTSYQSQAA